MGGGEVGSLEEPSQKKLKATTFGCGGILTPEENSQPNRAMCFPATFPAEGRQNDSRLAKIEIRTGVFKQTLSRHWADAEQICVSFGFRMCFCQFLLPNLAPFAESILA